tara:strand:+ start:506165 stop:507373 length:1209 start_codon:yes stop_codon:yes gene_type:complete
MILNVKGKLSALGCSALLLGMICLTTNSHAGEWSGYSAAEYRYFQHPSLNAEPDQHGFSGALSPEFYHQWDDGKQSLIIAPFLRVDSEDAERTHADLREARWLIAEDKWELRLGVGKVYWGVTESQHLVDVINQTDQVENPDNEEKLGQPMLNLSLFQEWGTVDLFVLPYFRERTFSGKQGRLRSQLVVDTDNASYESGSKRHHIDLAIRWSHNVGDWDVGLSHFYGTNREPLLRPNQQFTALNPYYELMNQTGFEIQRTTGSWLWKLESIRRETKSDTFIAVTGGLEYTLYDVLESGLDVGLISEYLFDDRDDESATPFEDDVMLGTRITWNDVQSTELLIGLIQDVDSNDAAWSIEASRRIGNRWKLSVEGRLFKFNETNNALYQVRNDDYIQVELARYF